MRITKVIGFQQFTSTALSTAVFLSTALLNDPQSGQNANAAYFTVSGSTGAIRFRDDPTTNIATATIGIRLVSGLLPYLYQGNLQRLSFISEGGVAALDINYVQVTD
jgi:hypothetical protein